MLISYDPSTLLNALPTGFDLTNGDGITISCTLAPGGGAWYECTVHGKRYADNNVQRVTEWIRLLEPVPEELLD